MELGGWGWVSGGVVVGRGWGTAIWLLSGQGRRPAVAGKPALGSSGGDRGGGERSGATIGGGAARPLSSGGEPACPTSLPS